MAFAETGASKRLEIDDSSQVGDARRRILSLSGELGFSVIETGKIGIVVTECASNLIKHAGKGEILFSIIRHQDTLGLQLLALDSGPGMTDTRRCMEDGYSTASSPGTGLGAIMRQSDECDIYSLPGKGTVLMARFWLTPIPCDALPMQIGTVCLPLEGESECGDGWGWQKENGVFQITVADGLGHGNLAAEAANAAVDIFRRNPSLPPADCLQSMHMALKSTRGAAAAVTHIDSDRREVRFAGVGNISACVLDGFTSKGLMSHNGTVGHQFHKAQELRYHWPQGGMLVMHSDGLATRWKLDDYPGLRQRHPTLVAAVLYRDFSRGRDDITVVVARERL